MYPPSCDIWHVVYGMTDALSPDFCVSQVILEAEQILASLGVVCHAVQQRSERQ